MSNKKNPGLTRRASGLMALEQRFMFDGAAVADALDTAVDLQILAPAAMAPSESLTQAEARAEQLVTEFLKRPDAREQLFALFKGDQTGDQATPDWQAAVDQLLAQAEKGELNVRVELRSAAELQGAKGAFSATGTTGEATIYLNADWVATADSESVAIVLTEELGHYLDHAINGDADTAGDEGEVFAQFVVNGTQPLSVSFDLTGNDHAILSLDGQQVLAELASFNFVNAYEMVYDLDNDTASRAPGAFTSADIDTTERWASKEQNSHFFNASVSLGVVSISDGTNGQNFSGNDVSASTVIVGGNTYHGWISRPIKAGGVVRGFYFWTDTRFTTLALAQADGNQDGDTSLNNRGFLFVVDQNWFNEQITANGVAYSGTPKPIINNTKDGNLGSITVANVGSSSDRVDSALNSVMVPNSAPLAANDIATVLEDSSASGTGNTGNVLSNDSDPNSDALTVTSFSVGTTVGTVGTPITISGVGNFTLASNGNYTFVPVANYAGPVPTVTYTVSDGTASSTATLTINITPVNDAPAGADKTVTLAQGTSYSFTSADFGFSDASDSPANTFLAVKITTLPTDGTLTLNGTAVALGQTIGVANLTQLRFTPAAGGNGSSYASFTFQVQDNGGTANGGADLDPTPNTITFNVSAVNSAPVGLADTTSVGEAGGVNNGTNPTPNVTGNVLTNDTDPDAGDTKTVTAVAGLNIGTVGSSVAGRFGSVVLASDGIYTYTVDNDNPTVQALRLVTDTLSDVFTYTVTDAAGLSSTTTLTITITGANDHPIAQDDHNAVKEGPTDTSGVWGSTTGNVLTNDSDVDGGALVVESVSIAVTTTTADVDVLTVTSTITSATVSAITAGGTNWNANGGIDDNSATPHTVLLNGVAVQRSDGGGVLTAYRVNTGANARLVFNHPLTLYGYSTGQTGTVFSVSNSDSLFRLDTITATVSSGTTLNVTSGTFANVAIGDAVSGTGIPASTTVTAVNRSANTITLSQAVQITSRDITFTGSGTTTTTTNTNTITPGSSTTITGNYGNLILSSSGAYTYNLTNNSLNDGQTATEAFTYTVNDSAGGSDTAVLNIRIDGRSAVAVAATNDSFSVNEDTTLSKTSVDGVLANDTASSTVSSYTWGGLTGTVGSALTYSDVGTLTLNSNGSFTFVPASNFNGSVPPVIYTISNGAGRASATLNITVTPANDAPSAVADTAEAREAGGYGNNLAGHNPTGNVLANDTDLDGNGLSVTAFSHGATTGTGTLGQALAGTYGSLTLNGNGSYTYAVSNNSAVVQALAAGQSVTDVFSYTASDGSLTSNSTLTVTVRGANDAPVQQRARRCANGRRGRHAVIQHR